MVEIDRGGAKLQRARNDAISLDQLVELLPPDGVIGMIFSAQQASWVSVTGGVMSPEPDPSVYEARFFGAGQEWRWLRSGSALVGQAAWIAEGEDGHSSLKGWRMVDTPSTVFKVQRQLLLRGKAGATALKQPLLKQPALETQSPESSRWACIYDPATGPYDLPIVLEDGRSAALSLVEYLAELDEFGNVGFLDERLVELQLSSVED